MTDPEQLVTELAKTFHRHTRDQLLECVQAASGDIQRSAELLLARYPEPTLPSDTGPARPAGEPVHGGEPTPGGPSTDSSPPTWASGQARTTSGTSKTKPARPHGPPHTKLPKRFAQLGDLDRRDHDETRSGQYVGSGQMVVPPPGPSAASGHTAHFRQPAQDGPNESVPAVTVRFYKQGYTIARGLPSEPESSDTEGELRVYTDPVHQQFVRDIGEQRVPDELATLMGTRNIDVHVLNLRTQDYVPTRRPFSGQAKSLGQTAHSVPKSVGASAPSKGKGQPRRVGVVGSGPTQTVQSSAPTPSLTPGQPVLRIAIRAISGARIRLRLNPSHTVQDIRDAVLAQARSPADQVSGYRLKVKGTDTFLDNPATMLADAKLANVQLIQLPPA